MVDLLKHNEEAYEKVKSLIEDGQKKIAVSHATGTGKSYLIAKLFEDFSNEKKLILVPSTYISDQIQALFEKYNIQNVEVILYQKLIKMSDEDTVTIYRGVKVNNYCGLSWTIDKNVAEWFARRFGHNGDKCYIFTGIINKKDILALFNSRNEKEVVCDYRKIKNIQCEEIIITDNPESQFDKHVEMCIKGE